MLFFPPFLLPSAIRLRPDVSTSQLMAERNSQLMADRNSQLMADPKILLKNFFRRRKIESCKSSETRVAEVSR